MRGARRRQAQAETPVASDEREQADEPDDEAQDHVLDAELDVAQERKGSSSHGLELLLFGGLGKRSG